MIAAHLGDSLAADARRRRARTTTGGRSSRRRRQGLGTTFVPSILGFGAVLDNLSAFLDNQPMAATIAGATAAWLVLWSFLSGGVLDRYARSGRRARTDSLPRAAPTSGASPGSAFSPGSSTVSVRRRAPLDSFDIVLSLGDAERHRRAHRRLRFARCCYLVFGMLLVLCNVVFDYARIRIVVEDRRSAIGALVAGARFVRRHPATLRLYLLNACCFVLLALIYALVAPGARIGRRHLARRSASGRSTSCCGTT